MPRTPRPADEPSAKPAYEPTDAVADKPIVERVVSAISDAVEDAADQRVIKRVASAIGGAIDAKRVASAIGDAVDAAKDATTKRLDEISATRVRRVRRLGRTPLPYLFDVHPEARNRPQRELGLRTVDLDEIAGTAVGGAQQRGADFLPLKPFRSLNWQARWQRLRKAADNLAVLPPIDVLRYRDRYWVLDGHNRVALGLYGGQLAIDANVTEIVAPGETSSERPESFESLVGPSRELRTAVTRRDRDDPDGTDEPQ